MDVEERIDAGEDEKSVLHKRKKKKSNINKLEVGALHKACSLGFLSLTHELLQEKPELALAPNSQGETALHVACLNGRHAVVELLLGYECSENDVKLKLSPLYSQHMFSGNRVLVDHYLNTPLICSLKNYNGTCTVNIIRKLMEKGADLSQRLDADLTLLHWAVWHECLSTEQPVTRFLLDDKSTSLDLCVFANDPTAKSEIRLTPLDIAALKVWEIYKLRPLNLRHQCEHLPYINYLIEHPLDLGNSFPRKLGPLGIVTASLEPKLIESTFQYEIVITRTANRKSLIDTTKNAQRKQSFMTKVAGFTSGYEAVELLFDRVLDEGATSCKGYHSPVAPVMRNDDINMNAAVLNQSTHWAWCYPIPESVKLTDREKSALANKDPNAAGLLFGFFVYFDSNMTIIETKSVCAGDAFSERHRFNLGFQDPLPWIESFTESLRRNQRFQELTIARMYNSGFHEYAWINPGEVLTNENGESWCPSSQGAFVYLINKDLKSNSNAGSLFFALKDIHMDELPVRTKPIIFKKFTSKVLIEKKPTPSKAMKPETKVKKSETKEWKQTEKDKRAYQVRSLYWAVSFEFLQLAQAVLAQSESTHPLMPALLKVGFYQSPFHVAVLFGSVRMVELLLDQILVREQHKVPVSVQRDNTADEKGNASIQFQALPGWRDSEGNTPFHMALMREDGRNISSDKSNVIEILDILFNAVCSRDIFSLRRITWTFQNPFLEPNINCLCPMDMLSNMAPEVQEKLQTFKGRLQQERVESSIQK